jgi:hypothetical protein
MLCVLSDGRVEVVNQNGQLPYQGILRARVDRFSFATIISLTLLTFFFHCILPLLQNDPQCFFLFSHLAQHDQSGDNEISLGSQAQLEHTFDEG